MSKVSGRKGRKPSAKIASSDITEPGQSIITCLHIDDDDIAEITGKKVKKSNVQIIKSNVMDFDHDYTDDLETRLDQMTKERDEWKMKYLKLEKTYKRFEYLENIVSDNGTVDKQYYVPNIKTIDVDKRKWKESTDIYCGWCCHGFETVPISLPESYNQETKQFTTRGCFCSFDCAQAYNIALKDQYCFQRLSLLSRIKTIIFKDTEYEQMRITAAADKETLKVFGGTKTITEFRRNKISVPKRYINRLPPTIPFFTIIEEIPEFIISSQHTSVYDKLRSKTVDPKQLKEKPISSAKSKLKPKAQKIPVSTDKENITSMFQ